MRRRALLSLAAVSLLLTPALAVTRPRYGGTLRVETRAALASYDPSQPQTFDSADVLRDRIAALVFDRLVTVDAYGQPRPALAVSWHADPDQRRWTFDLRPGVTLHDGNVLSARLIAAALAAVHPNWRVSIDRATPAQETIVIVSADPQPNLLAELATARNAIVARAADGTLIGSGPFRMQDFQPGRRAVLAANAEYWGGRPYLGGVDILMGRPLREQALDYRLDRAEIVEVSPEQARRGTNGGERIDVTSPLDMLGILFPPGAATDQQYLRAALSLAIDRSAIDAVLLQRQGEAAGGFLPNWISGYAFLFPRKAMLERARQERSAAGSSAQITLAFDATDSLQRAIADRIAVNARDAGVNVQTFAESGSARAPASAARIAILHLASPFGAIALSTAAATLGRTDASAIAAASDPETLYSAERGLLSESRFVPVISFGEACAVAPRVRGWQSAADGSWSLPDVSLQEAP